jgi:phage FluMu protein Com
MALNGCLRKKMGLQRQVMTLRDFYCKDCGALIGHIEADIIAKCPKCHSLNSSARNKVEETPVKKTPGKKKAVK